MVNAPNPEEEESILEIVVTVWTCKHAFLIWLSGILGSMNHYSLWPHQGRSYIYSHENVVLYTVDLTFVAQRLD